LGGGGIHCADAGPADVEELFMSKANEALDKMAENARQVGLDYEPAQRTWQGLTDKEIEQGCKESWVTEQAWQSAVWWAEAKLKEKNT
jgi:hypothetical protein